MEITFTIPKDIFTKIKENINLQKTPEFNLITGKFLRHLQRKTIVKLVHLFNTVFRSRHLPRKASEVILIPKRSKTATVSLLPVILKLFRKVLLKSIKPVGKKRTLIPTNQFGFMENYSILNQVHRITDQEKFVRRDEILFLVFLDYSTGF